MLFRENLHCEQQQLKSRFQPSLRVAMLKLSFFDLYFLLQLLYACISAKLVAMINKLPKTSEKLFGKMKVKPAGSSLIKLRKRMSEKLQNPRIRRIYFHTLRHWKATMKYHKTKDILHVMQMLGHRNIQTTLIYTHLVSFEGDEFHSAVAETVEEAKKLVEAGFEYVCNHNDTMLFRKRK